MKRLSFAFALLVMMAVPAFAAGGGVAPYVEVKAGGAYEQIDSIKNTSAVAVPFAVNKTSVSDYIGVIGGAAGLNFKGLGIPVRAELEYTYHSKLGYNPNPVYLGAGAAAEYAKTDVDGQAVFINAYYDFETGTAFTPYVGGGLGMSWNHTKSTATVIATGVATSESRTTDSFAWNLGAGCSYDLSTNWKLNAGYRFVDLGKVVWGRDGDELTSKDITAHEVLLGLRYQF